MAHLMAQNGDLSVCSTKKGWGELRPQPNPEDVACYYGFDDAEYNTPDGMAWLMKECREHEAGLWDAFYMFQARQCLDGIKIDKWNTPSLLDVGAGAGHFAAWWYDNVGIHVQAVEPSRTARESSNYIHVLETGTMTERRLHKVNVLRFSLVLEHVSDPLGFLKHYMEFLLPHGRVLVIVPNEFNPLQTAALRRDPVGTFRDVPLGPVHHHRRAWFVDRRHLNYFDVPGLRALFREAGLKVVFESSTFPIEAFLLMGMDYRKDPNLGAGIHRMRLQFEKTLGRLAFRLYKSFYDRWGVGRELVFVGEKK